MTGIWFYSVFPCFAAICCLFLLFKAMRSGAATVYLKLFANLVTMNFLQAIGYVILVFSRPVAEYMADAYLIAAYFLFAHFMQLALYLSEKERGAWTQWLYLPPVILTVLHLSGMMVDSYHFEENIMLHNDGVYAIIFDVFIVLSSIVTISTFIINSRSIKQDCLLVSKNIIAVISFIPFVLSAVVIVVLSNTQYAVPVVVIIPSLSLYIVMVFYYISRSQIIDLTIGPRAFLKRLRVASLLLSSLNTKKDLDDFNRQLQILKYNEAMQKHRNNYNAAAEELKMHSTTLRNALKDQQGNA
jgi:hypothetical protein